MLMLQHHDDGKEKSQSHEISFGRFEWNELLGAAIAGKRYIKSDKPDIYNLLEIVGYGETKDEAYQDFKNKFMRFIKEIQAIDDLWDTGMYQREVVTVDCFGEAIGTEEGFDD